MDAGAPGKGLIGGKTLSSERRGLNGGPPGENRASLRLPPLDITLKMNSASGWSSLKLTNKITKVTTRQEIKIVAIKLLHRILNCNAMCPRGLRNGRGRRVYKKKNF